MIQLILISLLTILILWISFLIIGVFKQIQGFDLLLEKFIEVNQTFYEGQRNIAKKDKEIFDSILKQTAELSIIRKYSSQLNITLKNITEILKSLKDTERQLKNNIENQETNKELAHSLSIVSNNIRILDKIAIDLKNSTDNIKRSKDVRMVG